MYSKDIKFSDKSIMCDFEKSLRTAIKSNLKDIELQGCYFHYAKGIYKRCKDYHLFTKNKKKETKLHLF